LFVNDGRACVMLVMMVVWELLKWSKCFGVKVDHVKLVEIQGKIL
jgi:hypothetical protein